MEKKIHVHKILEALIEKNYTIEELKTKFGKDTKFGNCSDINMNFDELIEFIQSKNKATVNEDVVSFNHEIGMCKHE